MRRLPAILVVAVLGLWLPGCSLFKKSTGGGGGGDGPNPLPPPKFPTAESKTDPLSGQSRTSGGNGLLAGRVLDGTSRPPAGTSILIQSADAKDGSEGQEAKVDSQGYFTIENLDRGGRYKLIARGKQGDRAVSGTHYAVAPNVHVLIQMQEQFASSTTPAVPAPYSTLNDDNKFEPLSPQQPANDGPASAWQPTEGVKVAGAELASPPKPGSDVSPNGIKQSGSVWLPPTLEVPLPPKANVPAPSKYGVETLGPARIPSCVLVGNQVENFALNDAFNGERWEFKSDRKGKLVLLDFWGTWCHHCMPTISVLKNLQTRFGGHGLEVIGIAYEQGGTPLEQGERVNQVCQSQRINYRQLLGTAEPSDIRAQLGVNGFPTLILLDQQGNRLWRHSGALTDHKLDELRNLIASQLSGGAR